MKYVLFALAASVSFSVAAAAGPFDEFTRGWRDDPGWSSGAAECAIYEALRVVDGQERRYEARLYVRKELASPQTFTASDTNEGRLVFRQYLREDIPADDGDLHFAVMCYVGADDLKSLKLELGGQGERGVTFKRFVNHAGTLRWEQYADQPKEGRGEGAFTPPDHLAFYNALPTVLRGYPFDRPADVELAVIDDQIADRWTSAKPGKYVVRYGGRQWLDLPTGRIEAHQLLLFFIGPSREFRSPAKYWFAVDPPLRHVLVQHEGPAGTIYRLKRLDAPDGAARSE